VRLDTGLVEAVLAHGAEARPARTTPAAAPLVEVREALADSEVRLQVELSPFELGLGALQSLQVDDVLRLQHRADAPATVIDGDGRALFRAWLARRHARWAVELAPLAGE
jgi:flagellar motor switch protein FliM